MKKILVAAFLLGIAAFTIVAAAKTEPPVPDNLYNVID
jgi:hypothetical protein